MYRFLIVDDHAVTRRGVKDLLAEAFPTAEFKTLSSAEEIKQMVLKESWSLIISDISMPGMSGLEMLTELKKNFGNIPVLILSMHSEEEYAVRVIKAGGSGYVCKDVVENDLLTAVNTILQGRKYITAALAEQLAREVSGDATQRPHQILSDREYEVFKLIAGGSSTGMIAEKLSISVNTVGTFRRRILEKMNLKNNAGIISYAIQNELMK